MGRAGPRKLSQLARPPSKREIRKVPPDTKIYDLYYWEDVLQEEGAGGKVVVCRLKDAIGPEEDSPPTTASTRSAEDSATYKYVMKIRSKASLQERGIEDEFRKLQVRMLNLPPHAGVVPIHEVLEDESFYYVVMERADGALFASLLQEYADGVMPASALQKLMREILEAVRHVHSQGMLHRDIKPDNLVVHECACPLSPKGSKAERRVRLIDFDHADLDWCPKTPRVCCHEGVGTLRFNAPETFLGNFSAASDIYSVGCILYLLMAGRMPFTDNVFDSMGDDANPCSRVRRSWRNAVYKRMSEAQIDFHSSPWAENPVCREFCQRLLSFHPKDRIGTPDEALAHRWIVGVKAPLSD